LIWVEADCRLLVTRSNVIVRCAFIQAEGAFRSYVALPGRTTVTVHDFIDKLAQLTATRVVSLVAWKARLVQDVVSGTLGSTSWSGVSLN
jgi:hypothetical protein